MPCNMQQKSVISIYYMCIYWILISDVISSFCQIYDFIKIKHSLCTCVSGLDSDGLRFTALWNQNVDLNNEKRVKLSCPGPYMVYLWACVESYGTQTVANLTLEQGTKLFHLQTLQDRGCQEMQSVFMLSNESEVTLKVIDIGDHFKIKKLFLGLHYMLGAQCFPYPL